MKIEDFKSAKPNEEIENITRELAKITPNSYQDLYSIVRQLYNKGANKDKILELINLCAQLNSDSPIYAYLNSFYKNGDII